MEKLILILFFCVPPALSSRLKTDVCYRLITDFSQDNCIEKTNSEKSYYYSRDSTCLPKCKEYPQKPSELPCSNKLQCLPGYFCAYRCQGNKDVPCSSSKDCTGMENKKCSRTCVPDPGSCMSYWANTFDYKNTYFSASVFKPSCTNEGKWKAIQCKGGVDGRCFCFDTNGKRLFGETMFHKSKQMTCACSRRKADLLSLGRNYVSLHCDSLGNYETLQCDSGLCWCAEPETGKVTAPVVPMKAMTKLPCYEPSRTGSQYYRQCDSIEHALATITETLKRHGVRYPNIGSIVCDGDGAYGAYIIKDGKAHCTLRDGNEITPSYASDASLNLDKLNCNCARDKQIYNYNLKCQQNGNYEPLQSAQSGYYCIDDDGFSKTEMMNNRAINCSQYY